MLQATGIPFRNSFKKHWVQVWENSLKGGARQNFTEEMPLSPFQRRVLSFAVIIRGRVCEHVLEFLKLILVSFINTKEKGV